VPTHCRLHQSQGADFSDAQCVTLVPHCTIWAIEATRINRRQLTYSALRRLLGSRIRHRSVIRYEKTTPIPIVLPHSAMSRVSEGSDPCAGYRMSDTSHV
jgi:hypothetical protein